MRKILICFLALFLCLGIQAQDVSQMMGLLPDDGRYDKLPRKAELLTRSYTILPKSHTLKQYCPDVRSQGQHGTCTSWATVYAARTIAEAVNKGWTDKERITSEAFSPLFVYALIKDNVNPNDKDCQTGTYISDALELMKEKGVPKISSLDVLCADYIKETLMHDACHYKIEDYCTLFGYTEEDPNEKIRKVRKALSEDRPVIIGMILPQSFGQKREGTWMSDPSDIDPSKHRGGHAMCVIGYDDNMNGGSFQIMNSWGKDYHDQGFVWVTYKDFGTFVNQAYEMYVKKNAPNPSPSSKQYAMDGEMRLASHNGAITIPVFYSATGDMPHYVTTENYLSGSKFRLYINNRKPAWVYVIASDLENNVSKLFPYNDIVSAYMNYSENNFALPDEQHEFEFDDTSGLDYFCVLYSQEELDIDGIIKLIEYANGSFYQKLTTVLGEKLIPMADVKYNQNFMGFSASSNRTVVSLVVEIPHRDIDVKYK